MLEFNLTLTEPQLCEIAEIVQDQLERMGETLHDMRQDGEDPNECVNQEVYIEELGELRDKINKALEEANQAITAANSQ